MNPGQGQITSRLSSSGWPILLILVLAAALRLNYITQPFIDDNAWRESSVAMMAENFYQKSWNIFYPEVNWVGPGPGYQGREFQTVSYISASLYTLLGQHDWIGRGVVVTFALFGIFALYQLIRRVWDEQRAIAAAALMAILPGVIRVERSFLPDPAMVALVVASVWMLVAYLQTDRRRYFLLACLLGALGSLTKLPGMIVGLPMAYATVAILRRRQILRPSKIALLAVVGLLTALPILAYYLWARHLSHAYPPYHFAGEGNWLWDQGLRPWLAEGYFLRQLWPPLTRLWSLPGLLLLFLGFLLPVLKRNDTEARYDRAPVEEVCKAPWLFHWWMAAGIIYYFIGARELIENPSNLHIISPAVAALSANAVVVLSSAAARQVRRPALSLLIAAVMIVGVGIWGLRRSRLHSSYAQQSYELGLELRSVSRADDLVVTLGDVIGCPVAIYYSGRRGWLFPPFEEIKDWEGLPGEQEEVEILERLRAKGATWLGIVAARKDEIWKNQPGFAQHIEQTCELIRTSKDASVWRLRPVEEIKNIHN